MKKYAFAFLLVLFIASFALAIQQQQPAHQKPASQQQKAMKTISGEIVSVDSTKNEVVLKDTTGADVRFTVNTDTKITRAGKTIQLAELKSGEKVTVECKEAADSCVAKSILVAAMKSEQ